MGFSSTGKLVGADDVAVSNVQNGQTLIYNSAVTKWVNASGNSAIAANVSFTPDPDSSVTATNVQDALLQVAPMAHGHSAVDITSGVLSIDRLPPGSVIVVDKARAIYGAAGSWPTSRPTSRTDIVVIWKGNTDPGSIAIAGDEWKVVP